MCWININQLSCVDLVALDLAIFLHMSGMAASGGHIRSALFTLQLIYLLYRGHLNAGRGGGNVVCRVGRLFLG